MKNKYLLNILALILTTIMCSSCTTIESGAPSSNEQVKVEKNHKVEKKVKIKKAKKSKKSQKVQTAKE